MNVQIESRLSRIRPIQKSNTHPRPQKERAGIACCRNHLTPHVGIDAQRLWRVTPQGDPRTGRTAGSNDSPLSLPQGKEDQTKSSRTLVRRLSRIRPQTVPFRISHIRTPFCRFRPVMKIYKFLILF